MDIKILNNYYNDQNTYLIYQNGIGAVIDVGYNESEIIKEAENLGVEIKYILLTHCHYDHIEFMEELREKTPLSRLGTPEDVARAVYFLASEQADFITGEVLSVNGGFVI